jgi:parallel beta-helix repeat protein
MGLILAATHSSYGAIVDVTSFGANGNDAIEDTTPFRNAVNSLQENDTLLIPESSGNYIVANNANFAINDPGVNVLVRGRVVTIGPAIPGNHMFIVTADRCSFTGEGGILEGSGSYVIDTDLNDPALIRFFSVDDCSVSGLRLRNGPRFWIFVFGSKRLSIRDCVFEGGPTSFSIQSQGIYMWGAQDILIRGNLFVADSGGGQAGSWIGSTSTSSNLGISILGNQFNGCHDHAVYCSGIFHSVIAGNVATGTGGTVLKTAGTDNVIANNNVYDAHTGGIEIRNSARCVVANNLVKDFGFVAVEVTLFGNGAGGNYTENLITGNTILANPSNPTIYEGIRVNAPMDCSRTKISGNLIVGGGGGGGNPALTVRGGIASYAVAITGNTLDQCPDDGIVIDRVNASIISDNIVRLTGGGTSLQQLNVTEANMVTDNLF